MSTHQTVLVVDDDAAMRAMLAELLRDEGYAVSEAASVDVALQLASEQEFDAVLSDIKMPGRSGLELLGEMRQLRPATPVVLMTAFGSIDAAVEAYEATPPQPVESIFDYLYAELPQALAGQRAAAMSEEGGGEDA